ncbi:universal stress protein [Gymnodinialimonas hymeniacidonis]|uniref:universal stress protein n=1 Tax=Gymnodinialimonas hymeniacidonis TaxID=3126508 RepID=UPI0034C6C16B
MYNHIIIAMALDHGYGPQAMKLAQTLLNNGGQITALHVFEEPAGSVNAFIDADVPERAFAAAKAKMADRMADVPNARGVAVKGHGGRTIVDVAQAESADLIIMGSHKPDLADFLLGSTAARVVRHAPCAVHVLRDTV